MKLDIKDWRRMMAYRFNMSHSRIVSRVVARGRDIVVQVRSGVKFIVPTYKPRV